jgi:hypothetical protein
LHRWIAPRGRRWLDHGAPARLLCDGWFELHLERPVEAGLLLAEAGLHGTGTLAGLELSLDTPPQDLRIVVSGAGALRGRIVDASGAPAAGLDVLVLLAALDDERGSFVLPEPDASLRRIEGGGRLYVTGSTDSSGRFEARGLRPEPVVVRARTGPGYASGYPLLLTHAPCRPTEPSSPSTSRARS